MKNPRESLADRLETAAKAKQALLEKARAKDPANDPEFAARQEQREAAARARREREADRHIAKLAERAKETAERNARHAEQAAHDAELAERRKKDEAAALIDRKAARDARYAARKARKK